MSEPNKTPDDSLQGEVVEPRYIDREYMIEVRARPLSENRMSNFDHEIDEGMEEDLRNGMRSEHFAWDFCGSYVWYDKEQGVFCEQVWQWNKPVATVTSDTLENLMRHVNDQFGWK